MSKPTFTIVHDLSKMDAEQVYNYLRDVSEFIGLAPDLNALDTIWMQNENGPGQSLVVYARRGTAEILREKLGIDVTSLTSVEVKGSIVFTAIGKNKAGRQEIATGSKFIANVNGKQLDDAIMTASTRALRRLTMQFTSLGILDESEVRATVGDTSNPASGAQLAGSAMVVPPVPTAANNAPGRDVTPPPATFEGIKDPPAPVLNFNKVPSMQEMRDEATRQLAAKTSAKQPDIIQAILASAAPATPVVAPVTTETQPDINPAIPAAETAAKPKRARKAKNTVSLEGPEPETVTGPLTTPPPPATVAVVPAPPPAQAPVPVPAISAPLVADNAPMSAVVPPATIADAPVTFPGQPSLEQMKDYRLRVSKYSQQLSASEGLTNVQKMRAFITKMTSTSIMSMTIDQWEEMIQWLDEFANRNQIKGLVNYINDTLGVK